MRSREDDQDRPINGKGKDETGGNYREAIPTDLDTRRSAPPLAPYKCHHKQQLHGRVQAPHATPQQPTVAVPTR